MLSERIRRNFDRKETRGGSLIGFSDAIPEYININPPSILNGYISLAGKKCERPSEM